MHIFSHFSISEIKKPLPVTAGQAAAVSPPSFTSVNLAGAVRLALLSRSLMFTMSFKPLLMEVKGHCGHGQTGKQSNGGNQGK
jgi:hypothetical protein